MNKLPPTADRSANARRKLDALGLAFTEDAFTTEFACRNLETVGLFIEAGIDVNLIMDDNAPPIVWLAITGTRRRHYEMAKLLIDSGADVNAVSQDGLTALRMAIYHDLKDLARLLIESGADVCAAGPDGVTAIHTTAGRDRIDLARLLIEHGAEVNAMARDGTTALQIALSNNRHELAHLLIANGADANLKPTASDGPAEKREITHIIERLELLEEKFGIAISGLYASHNDLSDKTRSCHHVKVNFDVSSLSGGKLNQGLKINASAYNAAGQLLEITSAYIQSDKFLGFDSMSILATLEQEPAKIRLSPSAW